MLSSSLVHPLKIVPIGNSQGVRLPQSVLRRYAMAGHILMEERPDGLLLRGATSGKLSLLQTFQEMAAEQAQGKEDWTDFEGIEGDGLESLKW